MDLFKEQPFIHLIKTPYGYYFYDVNKDNIASVEKDLFEFLKERSSDRNCLSEESTNYLNKLLEEGYLSNNKIKHIEHPATSELEGCLESRIIQLVLQVTQACNLTCSYCPYANETEGILQRNHENKKMTWDTAKAAIDFFADHSYAEQTSAISFYGGEPLLAFSLITKAVEYAEEALLGKKLHFNITTNGTILTDEMISYIVKHKIHVMFSIDGPREIHDINRKHANGKGSFDEAFEALNKLINAFGNDYAEYVSINMVMDPKNNIDTVMKLFEKPLFHEKRITISSSTADDEQLANKNIRSWDYIGKMRYIYFLGYLAHLGLVKDLSIPQIIFPYMNTREKVHASYKLNSELLPDTGAPGGPCIPGQKRLFVSTDGDFYPCERVSEVSEVMKIGSLSSGFDFQKAKNLLNISAISSEECKNCWALRHCTVCCRAADGGNELSKKKKLSHCAEIRASVDSELQEIIVFREAMKMLQ